MKKIIGISIVSVVVIILASLSNVVGFQTVQSTNQIKINNEVNQKELLFQTIVDIANNKEIQGIILKYQISRGEVPASDIPVLTIKQLKQMYIVGLMLSQTIGKSRIHSIVEQYRGSNQVLQKEINAVIEMDMTLKAEITQLSNSKCDCRNDKTTSLWSFPILCGLLSPIVMCVTYIYFASFMIFNWAPFFVEIPFNILIKIGQTLNCSWP
jgi:hypothetical protein